MRQLYGQAGSLLKLVGWYSSSGLAQDITVPVLERRSSGGGREKARDRQTDRQLVVKIITLDLIIQPLDGAFTSSRSAAIDE